MGVDNVGMKFLKKSPQFHNNQCVARAQFTTHFWDTVRFHLVLQRPSCHVAFASRRYAGNQVAFKTELGQAFRQKHNVSSGATIDKAIDDAYDAKRAFPGGFCHVVPMGCAKLRVEDTGRELASSHAWNISTFQIWKCQLPLPCKTSVQRERTVLGSR